MFIVTCIEDNFLGAQYIEDTFGLAVERACNLYEQSIGQVAGDSIRRTFEEKHEVTWPCWGIYIAKPARD